MRRRPSRLEPTLEPNKSYSMDFLSDVPSTKRKIRGLNFMDDFTRESLAVYADFSISSDKVVEVLICVIVETGKPEQIRVDNGPGFLSKVFTSWCLKNGIIIKCNQPGKPMQNGTLKTEQDLQKRCPRCIRI